MNINTISSSTNTASIQQSSTDTSSIDDEIEQLEDELEEIEEDESLSDEEREQQVENIELQISRLEQEKQQASTQEVSSTTQTASIQQTEQTTMSPTSSDRKLRFDSYEAQSPAPSAGLYKMGHDQNGNPIIQLEETSEGDTQANQDATQEGLASYLGGHV